MGVFQHHPTELSLEINDKVGRLTIKASKPQPLLQQVLRNLLQIDPQKKLLRTWIPSQCVRQIPVYTPFETGSFKGCRAFSWKYAEGGPWSVSIDLWWQRLDNKWMEVPSAVVVCAERHNKEHVSWQYSAYKIPWRDYPVRKKGFGMPLFVTWIFLTSLE